MGNQCVTQRGTVSLRERTESRYIQMGRVEVEYSIATFFTAIFYLCGLALCLPDSC